MFKRLAMVGVAALVAASFGTLAASAQDGQAGSLTLTVDNTAHYYGEFKTAITLTGTYNCPSGSVYSGLNANVSQIQGKGVIIKGWGNYDDPLVCNGEPQPWTITDIQANYGQASATWKGGRATVNVSNGDCGMGSCTNVDTVIHIHH